MKYKCLERIIKKPKKNIIIKGINKLLIGIFISLTILISMEYIPDFKNYVNNNILTKNISFKTFKDHLGNILPEENNKIVKVNSEKIKYKSKKIENNKIILEVDENYLFPNIKDGIIISISNDNNKPSIKIETESEIINYININNLDKTLYDYVDKNEIIGEVINNQIEIEIIKDGEIDIESYLSW